MSIGSGKQKRDRGHTGFVATAFLILEVLAVWGVIAVGAVRLCGEWFRVIWEGREGFGGKVSGGGVVA